MRSDLLEPPSSPYILGDLEDLEVRGLLWPRLDQLGPDLLWLLEDLEGQVSPADQSFPETVTQI